MVNYPPPRQGRSLRRRVLILTSAPIAADIAATLAASPWRPIAGMASDAAETGPAPASAELLAPPEAVIVDWRMPLARAALRRLHRAGAALIALAPAWPAPARTEAARQGIHGVLALPLEAARLLRLLDLLAGPEALGRLSRGGQTPRHSAEK